MCDFVGYALLIQSAVAILGQAAVLFIARKTWREAYPKRESLEWNMPEL